MGPFDRYDLIHLRRLVPRRGAAIAAVGLVVVASLALGAVARQTNAASLSVASSPIAPALDLPFSSIKVAARPDHCQPGDNPELSYPLQLQGQVPQAARLSGLAAHGYNCNLSIVANFGNKSDQLTYPTDPTTGWANHDLYTDPSGRTCAYYSDGDGASAGIMVLDVTSSASPVLTGRLTGAGNAPWESLRVSAPRGLLFSAPNGSSTVGIWDIAQDCRAPQRLFGGSLSPAVGHESWLTPDGNTWWVSRLGPVVAVDVSDPRAPRTLSGNLASSHGGSSSDDGMRQYFCESGNPDNLVIWDSSDFQLRKPDPQLRLISRTPLPGNAACQQTYPVWYGTTPYVIQFGESATGGSACPRNDVANFSRPRIIDISDERAPKIVQVIQNEVGDPANCALIVGDENVGTTNPLSQIVYTLFLYGTHQCTPDRLYDPTILACAEFSSGVRVYDIRNPFTSKEIAYFNAGTGTGSVNLDHHASRPFIRAAKGLISFPTNEHGYYVMRFAPDVYPFPESLTCPRRFDWLFAAQNPEIKCQYPPQPTPTPTPAPHGDQATGGGWLATLEGDKINFGFDTWTRDLAVHDHATGVKVRITAITSQGAVSGDCDGITASTSALEFSGSGTYNGSAATFRVCVKDSAEPGAGSDRFSLRCTAGCAYATSARTADSVIDGGNVEVTPATTASSGTGRAAALDRSVTNAHVLILDPILASGVIVGAPATLSIRAFDGGGHPLGGASVTLATTSGVGIGTAVADATGLAAFVVTGLDHEVEYIASAGVLTSNTVYLTPASP